MEQARIDQFVKEQVDKWKGRYGAKEEDRTLRCQVITVCTEPGSGGRVLGEQVARELDFDFFYREIIKGIAESARMSAQVIDSLEKERLSGVEDFMSSLIKEKYMYPGDYLRHLMKVVGTIGKHGNAVIVGRGANFIIPPEGRLRVRVISPLEVRIENLVRQHGVTAADAKRRIIRTENDRRAFIRKYFNADIANPTHYDLVMNTGTLQLDHAVETVTSAAGL